MRLDEQFQEAKEIILSHRILLEDGESEEKCASTEEQAAYKQQFQFSDLDNDFKIKLNQEWVQWQESCEDKSIKAFFEQGLYPQTRDLLIGLSTHIRNIKLSNKNFMIDVKNGKPLTNQGMINFYNSAEGIMEHSNVLQSYIAYTKARHPSQTDYLNFLNKESVILTNLTTTLSPFAHVRNEEGLMDRDKFMQAYPDNINTNNPTPAQTTNTATGNNNTK